ncbi:alpha/beta-hydrolase [Aureobasidium pullulans]|uniref:Carboxypeptidase n=1 Tax=Aureobasidium pullulans TaxID=5580 RepID=A0A4S9BAI3_AURPU|nr:alpha/beta-hydrolase [Aureobasidium pullulans]
MHLLSLACTATSLLSLLPSPVLARSPKSAKYERIQHERRIEMFAAQKEQQQDQRLQKRANHAYLTNNTAPFAVNGSGLPEVDFDIGESYAGSMPIGNSTTDSLFFWFVPTTNPLASDEIVIWLNGGPGCSSLDGFFHENGPVNWASGTYRPVRNTYSWSNLTNVIWIDQPISTGFSTGNATATNEDIVATQFLGFWRNFMDAFDLKGRKIYITGESYAGMYTPYIASAMLKHNDTSYYNVNGLMVYDPSIGYDGVISQAPALSFVDQNRNFFPLNDTINAQVNNISESCGLNTFMETAMTFPPTGPLPPPPSTYEEVYDYDNCDIYDILFTAIFEINPCFDIYQLGQQCPLLWDSLGFPYSYDQFYLPDGYSQPYFNRTDVKKAIHAPLDVDWEFCLPGEENPFVGDDSDTSPPSGLQDGPLQHVIESTNNVIIGHGTLDFVLFANGTLATLQNLTWNGVQGFSEYPKNPFYVPYHDHPIDSMAGAGIFGSWVEERGLTFMLTQLAGHFLPQGAPSAAYRHLEKLLGRIEDLSEVSSYTTQRNITQPQENLGNGTAWGKREIDGLVRHGQVELKA